MHVNYIALAIPIFFALIGVEMLVARLQNKKVYRFHDAVTDMGCGIGQQVTGILFDGFLIGLYLWIYKSHTVIHMGDGWFTWVVTFFLVDIAYYWWHRTGHRVNLVWAAHVVHHQSQDYNLAVALRQPWFSSLTSAVFYLPMAFLGINPVIFLSVHAFNILYQFWIHTETIGKLGPLEYIFNTPSHHRVHHAINPKYIDKNYAGTLIVWDRLFGTFAVEDEPTVYGTVKPYKSWNSLFANFEYFGAMMSESRGASLADKARILFKSPEWRPGRQDNHVIPPVDRGSFVKFTTEVSSGTRIYVFIHFLLTVVATTALLWNKDRWPGSTVAACVCLILATVLVWAGLFENKKWAKSLEVFRVAAAVIFIAVVFYH